MPNLEVLILELFAIDRLSASALMKNVSLCNALRKGKLTITAGEVTTLDHELLNDTVEGRALITKALLAGSESP